MASLDPLKKLGDFGRVAKVVKLPKQLLIGGKFVSRNQKCHLLTIETTVSGSRFPLKGALLEVLV